jgi:GNAT superfamily N-acetyltransferase
MSDGIYTRRWAEADWEAFKAIRLEALGKHENFFAVSVNSASSKEDGYWKDTLLDVHKAAVFGLYDVDKVIGLTAIFRDWTGREGVAVLCMSYIREEYRGQGLSEKLYEARIDWAKSQGDIRIVTVGHREGNDASRAANQRWGFELTEVKDQVYGNGETAKDYIYELKI